MYVCLQQNKIHSIYIHTYESIIYLLYLLTYLHTHMYVCICTFTYMRTHIHTDIHTEAQAINKCVLF